MKRDGKYEGSAESDRKVSASTDLEEASASTATPIITMQEIIISGECVDLVGLGSCGNDFNVV